MKIWKLLKSWLRPEEEEEQTALDTYAPTKSLKGKHPQVGFKQTLVVSEQVLAPLNTKIEQQENVFGAATIVNESARMVTLRNDLLFIILQPGQRHTITGEILKASYDSQLRQKTIEKWDPLNTLKDLIAEHERAQDPLARYNWSRDALVECSELKAFRVRGAEKENTQ
jgi:hypothetical protein